MKALLIIAHGSRRKDSNDEVRRLADRIRENAGPPPLPIWLKAA
jgi:sirohydrochlorin ferrochelatase